MADWSELLPDLLVMIARKIQIIEDFVAFGSVCKSWRSAACKENFVKPTWPTVPWLMLAEKEDSDDREFFSVSSDSNPNIRRTMSVSLPEAKNKRCLESRGWLVTMGDSGVMNLLNPFSRRAQRIELPSLKDFPDFDLQEPEDLHDFVSKAVLSASPSTTSSHFVLMVVSLTFNIGFWRPGDESWTIIESYNWKPKPAETGRLGPRLRSSQCPNAPIGYGYNHGAFSDVNYYKGKFYAICYIGYIWALEVSDDPSRKPPAAAAHYLFSIDFELIECRESYLVESAGELLVVARNGAGLDDDDENYGVTDFRIIRLDLDNSNWEEITSLGERAIFVGHNSAFSVDATSFPGVIKPNCIYFTDDCVESYTSDSVPRGGGKDMGIYNVADSKIERFDDVQSFSKIGPPVWVAAPSL